MNDLKPKSPTCEVISIGDELTSGNRLDTNSQWLSQKLNEIGLTVSLHSTVSDDAKTMDELFLLASKRSNIVLVTGGLGPTADDLTRETLANTGGIELQLDQNSLDAIRMRFESFGREMSANNVSQAMFPIGSKIIPNPLGTAPGVDLVVKHSQHQCRFFALPGVPAELKRMWQDTVRQEIQKAFEQSICIKHHSVHCFGLSESGLESQLPNLIERGREPTVGITASKAIITLRITAKAIDETECDRQIDETVRTIRGQLQDHVFGENGISLQQVMLKELELADRTLSVLDLSGCGLIADWLHEVDPEGRWYKGTLSASGPVSDEQQDSLCEATRIALKSELVLIIGPTYQIDSILHRNVVLDAGESKMRTRFNVLTNSPITVTRGINQAINFVRLVLQRKKLGNH